MWRPGRASGYGGLGVLLDRVLIGLGGVVIAVGAALGWSGLSGLSHADAFADSPTTELSDADPPVAGPYLPGSAPDSAPEARAAGDRAAPAPVSLGGTRWWSTPWESSWGDLRAADADAASNGSGDTGAAGESAAEESAEVAASAAGRVLAAGLQESGAPATVPADLAVAFGSGEPAEAASGTVAGSDAGLDTGSDAGSADGSDAASAADPDTASDVFTSPGDLRAAQPRAAVARAAPSAAAVKDAKKVVVGTYAYGPWGAANEMDVYRTAGAAADPALRQPAVVFIHGGSWTAGRKNAGQEIMEQLAGRGYTGVSIEYRLASAYAWPAQRTDVVRAVQALKDNAALYNVDPDRIILMGSSAGAQLAGAAATWEGAPNLVRAFISFSGPMDMYKVVAQRGERQQELAGKLVKSLMRCEPQDCAARYDDATPARHLDPSDPRSLLIAAENDWVSWKGAREFSAASNDIGVPSDFWMIPGDTHGRGVWRTVNQRVIDWMADVVR